METKMITQTIPPDINLQQLTSISLLYRLSVRMEYFLQLSTTLEDKIWERIAKPFSHPIHHIRKQRVLGLQSSNIRIAVLALLWVQWWNTRKNEMKHLVLIAPHHSNGYTSISSYYRLSENSNAPYQISFISFSLLYRLLVVIFYLAFFRSVFLVLTWDEMLSLPSHHTFLSLNKVSDVLTIE